MSRDGGDLARTRRLGPTRFEHAVRKELARRGKARPCLRIVRNLDTALADPTGVIEHRTEAFERIGWVLEDWDTARTKLAAVEARMVTVLDDLELTELACSIQGLSPVGAAAILAETGDLRRFASARARAVVKHAGLAPRERKSGTFTGHARSPAPADPICEPQPGARPAEQHRLRARYRHLTTRETNRLKPTQAETVIAAAILGQLHAVITTGQAWDPAIATTLRSNTPPIVEVAA